MTTATRAQPTFGRRGQGTPQKIRIVAPAPVQGRSGPVSKATPSSVRPSKNPTPSGIALTALIKGWTTAAASAAARLHVAAAAAVQHGKSAFADLTTARATRGDEAAGTSTNGPEALEHTDVALPVTGPETQPNPEIQTSEIAPPDLDALVALEASNFDFLEEIEPPEFDYIAEIIAAGDPGQGEALKLSVVEPGPTSQDLDSSPASDIDFEPFAPYLEGVSIAGVAVKEPVTEAGFQQLDPPEPSQAAISPTEVENEPASELPPLHQVAATPEATFPVMATFPSAQLPDHSATPTSDVDFEAFAPSEAEAASSRNEVENDAASELAPVHQMDFSTTEPVASGTWVAATPSATPPVVVTFPSPQLLDHPSAEVSNQYDLFASHPPSTQATPATQGSTSDDWIWCRAYFLACAVAFPSAFVLTSLLGGPTNPLAGIDTGLLMLLAVVSPPLGLVLFLPAVALIHLARLARIPSGVREILAGGILGSSWLLLALNDGVTPPVAAFCCIASGLLGGCVFWWSNRRIALIPALEPKIG